jgi:PST family polysaccharide transporter/lipopolysaccharide exporter
VGPDILRAVAWRVRGLLPSGDIGERAVKSGVWAAAINVLDRVLHLTMLVLLGRLLGPTAFGLLGIALVSLATLRQLSKLGLDAALIQRPEANVDHYLDTVWTLKAVRGALIAAVAVLAAPAVAGFFGDPRAEPILAVVGLSPLLVGIQHPEVVYFRKDLAFHRQFVYRLSGTVGYVGVGLGLAVLLGNVWALVGAYLAEDLLRTLVSYLLSGSLPRPSLDVDAVRELVTYGKWITGSRAFNFLFSRSDDVVVGWLLGAGALGSYQMGYRLARAPSTEVTQVISQVMLPTYAKLQADPEAVREAYFTVLKLITLIAAPMAVGIAVVASPFVETFLGDDWLPMVPAMQLLAVWGLALAIGSSSGSLFKAIGRPDYITKVSAIKTVVLFVLLYPLTVRYGFVGTAAAAVFSPLVTSEPAINYLVVREIDGSYARFARVVGIPLAASLVMGAAVVLVRASVPLRSTVPQFLGLVVFGVVVYAGCLAIVERRLDYGVERLAARLVDRLSS